MKTLYSYSLLTHTTSSLVIHITSLKRSYYDKACSKFGDFTPSQHYSLVEGVGIFQVFLRQFNPHEREDFFLAKKFCVVLLS